MKNLLIALMAVFVMVPAFAQVGVQPAAFNVDFASFKSDSSGYDLMEVYYQIYSSNLLYVRQDNRYHHNAHGDERQTEYNLLKSQLPT